MEILLQNFKKVQGHCSCESARTSSVLTGSKTQDIQETLLETHCHKIDQSGIRCLAVCSWLFNLQCLPSVAQKNFDNAHGEQRSPKAQFPHRHGLCLQQDRPNLTRVVQVERMMIAVLQVRSLVGVKWKI